jgi:putative transposase
MSKNNLIHARTCVYNVNYHIVWSVKYRRKVLNSTIEKRLKEILLDVAKEKGFTIVEMEVGEMDHIHLFVTSHPKLSISYIVKMMKGISGRLLMKEYPTLKEKLWKGELWNPSYYVETIGSVSEENIKRYIQNQEKGE